MYSRKKLYKYFNVSLATKLRLFIWFCREFPSLKEIVINEYDLVNNEYHNYPPRDVRVFLHKCLNEFGKFPNSELPSGGWTEIILTK